MKPVPWGDDIKTGGLARGSISPGRQESRWDGGRKLGGNAGSPLRGGACASSGGRHDSVLGLVRFDPKSRVY